MPSTKRTGSLASSLSAVLSRIHCANPMAASSAKPTSKTSTVAQASGLTAGSKFEWVKGSKLDHSSITPQMAPSFDAERKARCCCRPRGLRSAATRPRPSATARRPARWRAATASPSSQRSPTPASAAAMSSGPTMKTACTLAHTAISTTAAATARQDGSFGSKSNAQSNRVAAMLKSSGRNWTIRYHESTRKTAVARQAGAIRPASRRNRANASSAIPATTIGWTTLKPWRPTALSTP